MKFVRVKSHSVNGNTVDYGWMMKLTTEADVLDWHINHGLSIVRRSFQKSKDNVNVIADIESKRIESMLKCLPVYVNRKGGWFLATKNYKESESVRYDVWPDESDLSPKYSCWEGGKHWYIRVGEVDVVVDGEVKWPTKALAEQAYEKWKSARKSITSNEFHSSPLRHLSEDTEDRPSGPFAHLLED
jgi:hypothetical protein